MKIFPYCPICDFKFKLRPCNGDDINHFSCTDVYHFCNCNDLRSNLKYFNVRYDNCIKGVRLNNLNLRLSRNFPRYELILYENRSYIYKEDNFRNSSNVYLDFRIEDRYFKDILVFKQFLDTYLTFQ